MDSKPSTPAPTPSLPIPTVTQSALEHQIDSIVADYLPSLSNLNNYNSNLKYWQSVIKAICKAESSFNIYETYYEAGLADKNGNDPATGMRYLSEGLMQLSYSDALPNRYACDFNISADKGKKEKDPTKTIFVVKANIECGMKILNFLVGKYGKFIFNSGNYWAVLKPENKRHSVYTTAFDKYMSAEVIPEVKPTEPVVDPVETGASNPQREDNGPAAPATLPQKLLWYPDRVVTPPFNTARMKTAGKYAYGYPQGAVVHYTSGRNKATKTIPTDRIITSFVQTSVDNKQYAYFVIAPDGRVFQQFPLNEWGYHAGESKWAGLKGTVSDELVGIEIMSAGKVTKVGTTYKAWFDETYSEDEVRFSKSNLNIQSGYYNKFTAAQEAALIKLLKWLKDNGDGIFEYKFVVGHDEVAPDRKDDPGASLSMTMPALRTLLEKGV